LRAWWWPCEGCGDGGRHLEGSFSTKIPSQHHGIENKSCPCEYVLQEIVAFMMKEKWKLRKAQRYEEIKA
jgi:hypothetical protein